MCFKLSRIQEVRRNLRAIASLHLCRFGLVLLQTDGVQQSKGLFVKVIRWSEQADFPSCIHQCIQSFLLTVPFVNMYHDWIWWFWMQTGLLYTVNAYTGVFFIVTRYGCFEKLFHHNNHLGINPWIVICFQPLQGTIGLRSSIWMSRWIRPPFALSELADSPRTSS